MYSKKQAFKEFIDTYFNLLKNIKDKVNNTDFNHFYNKNYFLKRTNVKLFINTWYSEISKKFFNQIMSNDILFFLNNDFKSNLKGLNSEFNINYYLDNLKTIYSKVDNNIFNFYLEQIKKLTNLSIIYFNTK